VVRRWIARELSPATRIRRLLGEAEAAIRNLARLAADPPAPAEVPVHPPRSHAALWFALGALAAAVAFAAGVWMR
jgi:ubiquinone biosynthesis protein